MTDATMTPDAERAAGRESTSPPAPRAPKRRSARQRFGPLGVPAITVAIIIAFSIMSSNFLVGSNLQDILRQSALPLIVAVGLTIPLIMGDFDLSIAAVAGFATTVVSVLVARDGMSLIVGIVVILLAGLAVGFFNGVMVSAIGLSALVVTIAVGSVLNGLEFAIAGSNQISSGYPEGFVSFARSNIGPIPTLFVLAAVVAVVVWFLLERTATGRNIRAIGGNIDAVRVAGINVNRTRIIGFMLCSGLAALAGILYAGQQSVAYPLTGLNVLLPSFAAVFIGAAAFKLGEFNIPGTVIGILIASIINNGLLLIDVASWAVYIFQGVILLVALLFARAVTTDPAGKGR
jgi:ribose transport system permease protein